MKSSDLLIRRLTVADAPEYRALRLRGFQEQPEAFTSSYEDEVQKSVSYAEARLSEGSSVRFWGAFVAGQTKDEAKDEATGEATSQLVGVVGLERGASSKARHRALVIGMFVAPEFTRRGIARALLHTLLDDARASGLELLVLTVTQGNTAAENLYREAKFVSYGIEPGAIKVQNQFFDKNHMYLQLKTS